MCITRIKSGTAYQSQCAWPIWTLLWLIRTQCVRPIWKLLWLFKWHGAWPIWKLAWLSRIPCMYTTIIKVFTAHKKAMCVTHMKASMAQKAICTTHLKASTAHKRQCAWQLLWLIKRQCVWPRKASMANNRTVCMTHVKASMTRQSQCAWSIWKPLSNESTWPILKVLWLGLSKANAVDVKTFLQLLIK